MQLIGYMDSPFVRRVAISMKFLGLQFDHRELSIWRDFEEFRQINPLVKVPTLVLDDGEVLVDSTLIIDYLESQVAHRSLMPGAPAAYQAAIQQIGIALIATEKAVAVVYETTQRPAELIHQPWVVRVHVQLRGALDLLESAIDKSKVAGTRWLHGGKPCQADITTAVMWRFTQHIDNVQIGPADYPALAAFSARAENLPEFLACPLSE
jgi:glutathione S-transferase